jgi:hypothetical protein
LNEKKVESNSKEVKKPILEKLFEIGNQTGTWLRKHILFVILSAILMVSYPFIIGIAILFGVAAVYRTEMLTALIEAEATIIGFFGLILTYALASFDNRIDKLEEHFYDLTIAAIPDYRKNSNKAKGTIDEIGQLYGSLLKNVRENRKRLVNISVFVGSLLMLSLFSAILALGIPNEE